MSPDGPKIVSPEEKLLRLIRGKGYSSPPTAQPVGQSAAGSPQGSQTTPPVVGSASSGRVGSGWAFPSWGLTAINIGLVVLVVAELIGWLLVATKGQPTIEEAIPKPDAAATHPVPPPPNTVKPQEPASSNPSLASVASRPLFQLEGNQQAGSARRPAAAPSEDANALAARLTLIGIVAGEPAQAIIEDAQSHKTFFVSVGQSLIEGLVVEEIRENRVVLDLRGETIELSL